MATMSKATAIMARAVSLPIPPVRALIAQDLLAWRISLNVSRRQLAAKLCLPRNYIGAIEKGREMPTVDKLAQIVACLEAIGACQSALKP